MAVRKDDTGAWRYRVIVKTHDGAKVRISGTPSRNTKEEAQKAERAHIDRTLNPAPQTKEVPTYGQWFWGADPAAAEPDGRFWNEWVIANKNKPSECESKKYIYNLHLKPHLEKLRLNEIDASVIAALRVSLVKLKLGDKRINNILAVLSKSLRWAEEVKLIDAAPRIRFHKLDRPEIEFYSFDEYARIVEAASGMDARWYAAVLLAGEAGLRVGEVKAVRWREDVDMVAKTVTVNRQVLRHVYGTPKGRTRRTVPMTDRLYKALKAISAVREGLVLLTPEGEPFTDSLARSELNRTCRLAGLPENSWHPLRHTFATHAAMFGVNPWNLNSWMGHKSMEETMRYVHVAEHHHRDVPDSITQAGGGEMDVGRRVIAMLGARGALDWRGKGVAKAPTQKDKQQQFQVVK